MSDGLNGLKAQAQVPPLSLSMVRTPLGPPLVDGPELLLLEQDAASKLSATTTPNVIRRLMLRPFGECSARGRLVRLGCPRSRRAVGRGATRPSSRRRPARRRSCQETIMNLLKYILVGPTSQITASLIIGVFMVKREAAHPTPHGDRHLAVLTKR